MWRRSESDGKNPWIHQRRVDSEKIVATAKPKTLMSYDSHAGNSLSPVHGQILAPVRQSTDPPSEDIIPYIG